MNKRKLSVILCIIVLVLSLFMLITRFIGIYIPEGIRIAASVVEIIICAIIIAWTLLGRKK